jgi:hypothetical protein
MEELPNLRLLLTGGLVSPSAPLGSPAAETHVSGDGRDAEHRATRVS